MFYMFLIFKSNGGTVVDMFYDNTSSALLPGEISQINSAELSKRELWNSNLISFFAQFLDA